MLQLKFQYLYVQQPLPLIIRPIFVAISQVLTDLRRDISSSTNLFLIYLLIRLSAKIQRAMLLITLFLSYGSACIEDIKLFGLIVCLRGMIGVPFAKATPTS